MSRGSHSDPKESDTSEDIRSLKGRKVDLATPRYPDSDEKDDLEDNPKPSVLQWKDYKNPILSDQPIASIESMIKVRPVKTLAEGSQRGPLTEKDYLSQKPLPPEHVVTEPRVLAPSFKSYRIGIPAKREVKK